MLSCVVLEASVPGGYGTSSKFDVQSDGFPSDRIYRYLSLPVFCRCRVVRGSHGVMLIKLDENGIISCVGVIREN